MSELWIDCTVKQGGPLTPGTRWADLEVDLSSPGDPRIGGRHPLPPLMQWCQTLGTWGVTPNTSVAVFDRKGGGLAAARCWWMLRALGHARVRLAEGAPERAVEHAPVGPYPASTWRWPTCSRAQVGQRLEDPDWRVLDARSGARHRGEQEPIDPVAGCLPGSVNLPWESLRLAGGWAPDLEARIRAAVGETETRRVVVSCGSGVTACVISAAMDRLGMDPPVLYVGSWSEWCRRPVD